MIKNSRRSHQKQSGSTLIVTLVILILIMMLGVSAMLTSDTQQRLAGNLQFEGSAMNEAESAIAVAEHWLADATGGVPNIRDAGFTSPCNSPAVPGLYPAGCSLADDAALNLAWDRSDSIMANGANSRYTIELISENNRPFGSEITTGGRSSGACNRINIYRISARGKSLRGATRYIQSYFGVLNCQ